MATSKMEMVTHLWFQDGLQGAAEFYTSIFPDSKVSSIAVMPSPAGEMEIASFELAGRKFMATGVGAEAKFNSAVTITLVCETQEEIDHYWSALSAEPEAEFGGWLRDRYGITWLITPRVLNDILVSGDTDKIGRAFGALGQMKKIDIATLERVVEGG